jgi:histidinol phosphatase-like enzyme (inositol monophosphatase family)
VRRYFRATPPAELKPDQSPVTEADRAAEQAMRAVIQAAFSDHGILGEEFGLHQPNSPYRWVLDPIDGTRAFITGRPLFGTLIALLHHGHPILGLIDQPILGERWLSSGGATTFRGPYGGTPATRACPLLTDAELSCTSPEMLGDWRPRWQKLGAAARRITWGGDCYAYGLLALGQIDVIAERDLKIWDWAALVPIVEGAGGCMTDWNGQKLTLNSAGDAIAVGDPALLAQVVSALAKGKQGSSSFLKKRTKKLFSLGS